MARLEDSKLNIQYPEGWDNLTDRQKKAMVKDAEVSVSAGIPVPANSLAAFAIAGTVEHSLSGGGSKNGKEKTALPASIAHSGFVKNGQPKSKS